MKKTRGALGSRPKQRPDDDKLRELVLHIALQSEGDAYFGAVKLNKLLFFGDFLFYRRYGRSITGQEYQALEHGPAPRRLAPLIREMEKGKAIAIRENRLSGRAQKRVLALREPLLGSFKPEEIAFVDSLIRRCWDKSAMEMSDISHLFAGWRLAKQGETIPYSVILVGTREPTLREVAAGLKLEARAKACLAS
jgi:hypothetical protein